MSDDSGATQSPVRFISGVYNHCDRWCERCRFQARCRVYRWQARAEGIADRPGDADPDQFEPAPVSPMQRAEFEALVDAANREPTPEEAAAIDASTTRCDRLVDADPISMRAEEYGRLAAGAANALAAAHDTAVDPVVAAALESIHHLALAIASKARRAARSWIESRDPEWGDEFTMKDANGSAKVARLAIAESREAWGVLMEAGRALADGVPRRMIDALGEIDAALAGRFPQAMAFVRAGFDEAPDG